MTDKQKARQHYEGLATEIMDETELTSAIVVGQRGYVVPLDVANEVSKLRSSYAELRQQRDELLGAINRIESLSSGGIYDLTDSPHSYMDNVQFICLSIAKCKQK